MRASVRMIFIFQICMTSSHHLVESTMYKGAPVSLKLFVNSMVLVTEQIGTTSASLRDVEIVHF